MPTLNLEHIACNVADPAAMAALVRRNDFQLPAEGIQDGRGAAHRPRSEFLKVPR